MLDFMKPTKNYRDVFHAGDCDKSVEELVELLGWKADFAKLIDDCEKAAKL